MSAVKAAKKKSRKRTHRYTSNVFSMFDQAQIHEFKVELNATSLYIVNWVARLTFIALQYAMHAERDIVSVCPSVRPSVCLSVCLSVCAGIVSKRMDIVKLYRRSGRLSLVSSSPTAVRAYKILRDPLSGGVKHMGWENLANSAFFLKPVRERPIFTMEH